MKENYLIRWNAKMTFCAAAAITTICIVLGLSSSAFMLCAAMVCALYITFEKTEAAVAFMFYLLPFANVFKFGQGSTSLFTFVQLLVIAKLLLKKRKISHRFFSAWFFLAIWQAVGCQLQVLTLIKQMIVPITVYLVLERCRIDTVRITKTLAISLLISSVIGLGKDYIPGLASYLSLERAYEVSGIVYRFVGLMTDPNHYSSLLILVTIGLICEIFNQKMDIKWLGAAAALVPFGLKTVSKSYFLMLCVIVLIVLLMFLKKKKYKWFAGGVIGALLVMVMVVLGKIDMFQSMVQRLTNTTDITTGRMGIWMMYLREMFDSPLHLLFGYGIAAETFEKVAHNTFIDLAFYYGIFGSVLYVYTIILIAGRKTSTNLFHIAPLICFMMLIVFLSYLMHYDLAFILIYVIAYMRNDEPRQEIAEEQNGLVLN